MQERWRFIQIDPRDKRLLKEAERRWKEARATMLGAERDTSTCKARIGETASRIKEGRSPQKQKALT
jgi:hypothetical protein